MVVIKKKKKDPRSTENDISTLKVRTRTNNMEESVTAELKTENNKMSS